MSVQNPTACGELVEETERGRDGRTTAVADCHFEFLGKKSSGIEWELITSPSSSRVILQNLTENNSFAADCYELAKK